MKILPAIDIKDKKCVRLIRGDFENKTEYKMSPVEQAEKYNAHGFINLHIVDLDGALTGETVNLDIIQEIVKKFDLKIEVGDNFGAGMTGGMAFVYDVKDQFENFANPTSIIWQQIETDHWKSFLKDKLNEFFKETNSLVAKKILDNFEDELKNFKQICPIEMLDKLDNPITLKSTVKKVS